MIRKILMYSYSKLILAIIISIIVHLLIVANIVFAKKHGSSEYVEIALISKQKSSSNYVVNKTSIKNKKKVVKEAGVLKQEEVKDVEADILQEEEAKNVDVNESVSEYSLIQSASDNRTALINEIAEPEYPRLAREKGYEGTVVLVATISHGNIADDITVKSSSGYRILDRAAIDAVKRSRFNNQRNIVEIKYEFLLHDLP